MTSSGCTRATTGTTRRRGSAMSARLDALPRASVETWGGSIRMLFARVGAMCLVELQKMRRDKTELFFRSVQPALWLLVFGVTFTKIKAIPTGDVPYLDYLTPGVIAQSALFI